MDPTVVSLLVPAGTAKSTGAIRVLAASGPEETRHVTIAT
jgi:hypothetical protein